MVLHSFGKRDQDVVKIWVACHGVCRYFKYEVEDFFIANHLLSTCLSFKMTSSQGFNLDSRIEFHDYRTGIEYGRIPVDRAEACFRAKSRTEIRPFQRLHDRGVYPPLSHLVEFWRPFGLLALPRVFFYANGDAKIEWRVLLPPILPKRSVDTEHTGAL